MYLIIITLTKVKCYYYYVIYYSVTLICQKNDLIKYKNKINIGNSKLYFINMKTSKRNLKFLSSLNLLLFYNILLFTKVFKILTFKC